MTPEPASRKEPAPRPAFIPERAALVAAVGLGLIDGLLLLQAAPGRLRLWGCALAVVGVSALLFAGIVRLVLRLTLVFGCGRWRRSLAGAVLASPLILSVSWLLFQGTGVSARWYAGVAPLLLAPLLLALTALGLWLAGQAGRALSGRRGRLLLVPPTLLFAALAAWIDRTVYPTQYAYLHWLLLLASVLALMAAGWLMGAGGRAAGRCHWLAPSVLLAAVPAAVLAALFGLPTQELRQAFAQQTLTAERLAGLYRQALDFDGDRHSLIFGERDCDNFDPRVHPFAPELAENGVDEDCDGQDLQHRPRRPPPGKLAEPAYRRWLTRWRQQPEAARLLEQSSQLNVVLIVVDALRADQLLPADGSFPTLEGLLAQSRSFVHAFSAGAGTDIGMSTLFTGQLDPFDPKNVTLPAAYRAAGFHTHGVFQREVERWLGKYLSLAGLARREVVINDPGRRDVGSRATSAQVTDRGIRFLERRPAGKFFLWLHYFDAHEHHQVHPRELPPGAGQLARGLPFYRALVKLIDAQVGRFLAALERLGLAQQTLIVLVGDHGEGLGLSPRLPANHGDLLYNPLVHVPLALRIPGVQGRQLALPVSLADVLPTLADLSALQLGPTHGLGLTPFVLAAEPPPEVAQLDHPLLLNEARQRGLIRWPYKLLLWLDRGQVELYDLARDPAEEHNLVDQKPALARELATLLGSYPLPVIDRLADTRR